MFTNFPTVKWKSESGNEIAYIDDYSNDESEDEAMDNSDIV